MHLTNLIFNNKAHIFCLCLVILFACKQPVETQYIELEALPHSKIFNAEEVLKFNINLDDEHKKTAQSYINRAELYKLGNPDMTIYCAKRAITIEPSFDHYVYLAEVYGTFEMYKEQAHVYSFLIDKHWIGDEIKKDDFIFQKPDVDLFYEGVVSFVFAKLDLSRMVYSANVLEYNLEEIKNKLVEDERIKMDRNSSDFKNLLLELTPVENLMAYAQKPESLSAFMKSVKDTNSVFEINERNLPNFNYAAEMEMEYMPAELEGLAMYYTYEKLNHPEQWFNLNLISAFKPYPNVNAIVYSLDSSAHASPKFMRQIYYRIVCFDNNAKLIDTKIIAQQAGVKLVTVAFNHTQFRTTEYQRKFKNNYVFDDFDNDIVAIETLAESNYKIQEDGKIVRF